MAWKQPGNNGQDRDPWGSSSNQGNNSRKNGNKGNRNQKQGSLDFHDIFHKLKKRFTDFKTNKEKRSSGNSNDGKPYRVYIRSFIVGIVAIVIIWIASGVYIIKENERGVVTRFGKFNHIVDPGINWKITFIDEITAVNVESMREVSTSGVMITSDENIVDVKMYVQYRVTNPKRYLFSVATNADDTLRHATNSILRSEIGKYSMDYILTESRTIICTDIQHRLEETMRIYDIGISVLDVNFQTVRPPEEVRAAFEDAIVASENEEQYIREAEAYAKEVQPHANGRAQRILEEAHAHRTQTILEAQGEVACFTKILPEYKAAPEITRERLYIETMEKVLSNTRNVLINNGKNLSIKLIVLPLDQTSKKDNTLSIKSKKSKIEEEKTPLHLSSSFPPINSSSMENVNTINKNNDIMDQRRANAQRKDYSYRRK